MKPCDALFVLNQDAAMAELTTVCRQENVRSAVILTTHRVLSSELECLRQIGPAFEVFSFADLMSETDLCHCDEVAEQTLRKERDSASYPSQFTELNVAEKNRVAHAILSKSYQFRIVRYTSGLGVAASHWQQIGKPLGGGTTMQPTVCQTHMSVSDYLRLGKKDISIVQETGRTYVFIGPLKRLRIRPGTAITKTTFRPTITKLYTRHRLAKLFAKFRISPSFWLRRRFGGDAVACTLIHAYDWATARAFGGSLVFVDGFHPSNYPRSYIDGYADELFVVRTMFDERWFTAYGKRTMKPPKFLEREYFAPCSVGSAGRVLVALNHAGDWTAVINRSDTDDLVVAAVELARRSPDVVFRVRLHPTMNHPAHEGVRSSHRMTEFVRGVNLANLHVSTQPLDEDLRWCDLCLSEYSQVLLDALRSGKLGLSLNVTKRRSFMQDYTDVGFFHAENLDDASCMLQRMVADPIGAACLQNKAVERYNGLLADWLEERRHPSELHQPRTLCHFGG